MDNEETKYVVAWMEEAEGICGTTQTIYPSSRRAARAILECIKDDYFMHQKEEESKTWEEFCQRHNLSVERILSLRYAFKIAVASLVTTYVISLVDDE